MKHQRTTGRSTPQMPRPREKNTFFMGSWSRVVGNCPKLRLKDACKRDMIKCSIDPDTWERQAEDRSAWRAAVRQGTVRAEAERIETATKKRARRKQRAQLASVYKCPTVAGIATPELDCTVTLGGAASQSCKATTIVSRDGRMPTTTTISYYKPICLWTTNIATL